MFENTINKSENQYHSNNSEDVKYNKLKYLENLLEKMENGEDNLNSNVADKLTKKEQGILELNTRGLNRDLEKIKKIDNSYFDLHSKYDEIRKGILSELEEKSKTVSIEFLKSKGYDISNEKSSRRQYYADLMKEADNKTFDDNDSRYALKHQLELEIKDAYSKLITYEDNIEDAKEYNKLLLSEIENKKNNAKQNLRNSIQIQIDRLRNEIGDNYTDEIKEDGNTSVETSAEHLTNNEYLIEELPKIDIKLGKFNYYPSRELEKNGAFSLTAIDKELESAKTERDRLEILTYKVVVTKILKKVENGESIKLDLDNDNTYDLVEDMYIRELPMVLEQNGFVGI